MSIPPALPAAYIKYSGHHWLSFPPTAEMMVAQWNPGSRTWTHSNAHDTNARPLELSGWIWRAHVEMPS